MKKCRCQYQTCGTCAAPIRQYSMLILRFTKRFCLIVVLISKRVIQCSIFPRSIVPKVRSKYTERASFLKVRQTNFPLQVKVPTVGDHSTPVSRSKHPNPMSDLHAQEPLDQSQNRFCRLGEGPSSHFGYGESSTTFEKNKTKIGIFEACCQICFNFITNAPQGGNGVLMAK